jgi:hypothetical protein
MPRGSRVWIRKWCTWSAMKGCVQRLQVGGVVSRSSFDSRTLRLLYKEERPCAIDIGSRERQTYCILGFESVAAAPQSYFLDIPMSYYEQTSQMEVIPELSPVVVHRHRGPQDRASSCQSCDRKTRNVTGVRHVTTHVNFSTREDMASMVYPRPCSLHEK